MQINRMPFGLAGKPNAIHTPAVSFKMQQALSRFLLVDQDMNRTRVSYQFEITRVLWKHLTFDTVVHESAVTIDSQIVHSMDFNHSVNLSILGPICALFLPGSLPDQTSVKHPSVDGHCCSSKWARHHVSLYQVSCVSSVAGPSTLTATPHISTKTTPSEFNCTL